MDYLFREAADDLSVTCRQNVQALLAGVIGVVSFFAASVCAGLAAAPGAIRIVAYLGLGVSSCPFINASIDMIAAGFGNISKRFRGRT